MCSFYRPPNNNPNPLNQLSNAIATLYENASPQTNIIIAGDFNVPDIIWTKGIGQVKPIPSYGTAVNYSLLDLASDYHLEQLMHENTRRNHILDLVFCTNPTYVSNVIVVPGISDHEAVSFCFNSTLLTYEKSTRTIYLYNQGNFDAIKNVCNVSKPCFSDPFINLVQENWSIFKSEILSVINCNSYVPQRPLKSSCHLPWLSKHIKSKMKQRKRLYNKAKSSQTPEDWAAYCSIKNEITSDIRRSHTNYQNRLFDNTSKNFWKCIKNLRKDCVGVSPLKLNGRVLVDGAEKADALNNQFSLTKISPTCHQLTCTLLYLCPKFLFH